MNVGEVGCGDGARCRQWAARGHQVYGVDPDPALIALARERAGSAGLEIMFDIAAPGALPWPDRSMDLCIVRRRGPAAPDWQACLAEYARVLRCGGALQLGADHAIRRALDWLHRDGLRRELARHGLACRQRAPLLLAIKQD